MKKKVFRCISWIDMDNCPKRKDLGGCGNCCCLRYGDELTLPKDELIDEYVEMCQKAGLPNEVWMNFRYFADWLFRHYDVTLTERV